MKGLLYKDFAVLANSYKRNLLVVVVLYTAIVVASRQAYLAYALTAMGGIYGSSTVSFDEQSHWDAYARTLPVTARQIVGAKYLLCLFCTLVLAVVSGIQLFGLLPLTAGLTGEAENLCAAAESMAGILGCAEASMMMAAVTLPFSYKYGGAKARSYMGLTFVVAFFLLFFVLNMVPGEQIIALRAWLDSIHGTVLLIIPLLLTVVCTGISYAACVKIYAKNNQ